MKEGNVIEVHDVHKKFKNYFDKSNSLKEKILHKDRNKYQEYWVLKGIDFDVKRGEAVGLVGSNGCGKSTTLKLLTKIIYPDKGNIEINGRVSSLLELGAGFHPDLSGYENIYLNAAVFGLTKKEIDNRVDEIIRFSELREYINNPIRTYSSGMYMKLAFSVAINVDADILLIDEILGVGDVSFQKKCFEKLIEIKSKGTTIVIVSHSTDQIERICDRSIWIENGKIKMNGIPQEVHKQYLDIMEQRRIIRKELEEKEEEREREKKEQKDRIDDIYLLNKKKRMEERHELEKRKQERKKIKKKDSLENSSNIIKMDLMMELDRKEQEEVRKQESLILVAEEERKKQQVVQDSYNVEGIPQENRKLEYYKKETNRLELVVSEKNIEIERLNSVIRQKELLLLKENENLSNEIERLEKTLSEKEDELDRLDEVILEKNEEIDRINHVIFEKDLELSNVLKKKTDEINSDGV